MNNLTLRVLFAVFAIPFFLLWLWMGETGRWILFYMLSLGAAWELPQLISKDKKKLWPARAFSMLSVAGFLTIQWQNPELLFPWTVVSFFAAVLLSFRQPIEKVANTMATYVFIFFYAGIWFPATYRLFSGPEQGFAQAWPFLFVAILMWVCDSGAYFAGRLLGKHKFAPVISPKKTWEGFWGGAFLTMLVAVIFGPAVYGISSVQAFFFGAIMSVSAPVGDLMMSAAKRAAGLKDFSQIFPGHGGVLDRFDSLFLSGPVAVAYLQLLRSFS